MNRRRKNGPDWLPLRVYEGRSAYEYHPRNGQNIRLAPLTASKQVVIARYHEELSKHDTPLGSFSQLISQYMRSRVFKGLAPRTQSDYKKYATRVRAVFGKIHKDKIKPQHIRKYMDKRAEKSETQANREHSFMSAVFSWAYEVGEVQLNPCKGVRKFSESSRERYIEDWEYNAVLACAQSQPLLAAAMEVSYCCAARQGDVWNLTREQLEEEGILIRQGKTKVKQLKLWNPRLRAAIDLALAQQDIPSMKWVFSQGRNFRPAQQTMAHWFADARKQAEKNAKKKNPKARFDFTFHDIKAKAISDYEGEDKKIFSGHKTDSQVAVYDRKTKRSPTLD